MTDLSRRSLIASGMATGMAAGLAGPRRRRDRRAASLGATPSPRQLIWHKRQQYAFVHFSINTFTGREWGLGDESPALFNPTDFDPDQIVAAAKAGGLTGIILTAKHHDGFCLWPTMLTEHCIRNSPYKNGKAMWSARWSAPPAAPACPSDCICRPGTATTPNMAGPPMSTISASRSSSFAPATASCSNSGSTGPMAATAIMAARARRGRSTRRAITSGRRRSRWSTNTSPTPAPSIPWRGHPLGRQREWRGGRSLLADHAEPSLCPVGGE